MVPGARSSRAGFLFVRDCMVYFQNMKQFIYSTATLIGMIIGVGIFAVPYVSARAGFWVGAFWIAVLGLVTLVIHLYFGQVVSGTSGKHRLAGYAQRYIGHYSKQAVTISQTIAFWGAQLAYIIVGGAFLRALFNKGDSFWWGLGVFAFTAIISFFGLRLFRRVEFYMTVGLILVLGVIMAIGAPSAQLSNLSTAWQTSGLFIPYGVVLFALGGSAALPEMWEIVGRRKRIFQASIIAGTLAAVLLTFLFSLVVVGVSGTSTSPEALQGLTAVLGTGLARLGALAGFFAIITSYLVLALYLKELFQYDLRVKHLPAWVLAVCVPFLMFLAGAQDYTRVIDWIGSVFGGFDAIMIMLVAMMFFHRRQRDGLKWKIILGASIVLLLVVGIIQKLFKPF